MIDQKKEVSQNDQIPNIIGICSYIVLDRPVFEWNQVQLCPEMTPWWSFLFADGAYCKKFHFQGIQWIILYHDTSHGIMDERKHCDLDVNSEFDLPSSTSVDRVTCHKFNYRLAQNFTCITGLCTRLIIHISACFLKSFHNKDHQQQDLITLVWSR